MCSRDEEFVSKLIIAGFVAREKQQLALNLVQWLPSHRAPVVLRSSSFLVLGVAFFTLAGVGLLACLELASSSDY
jgi:hypothetical protein